jgi:hypothetical protein
MLLLAQRLAEPDVASLPDWQAAEASSRLAGRFVRSHTRLSAFVGQRLDKAKTRSQ